MAFCERATDCDSPTLEIDVFPSQPDRFAVPSASREKESQKRFEAWLVIRREPEESLDFFAGPRVDDRGFRLLAPRHTSNQTPNPVRGVSVEEALANRMIQYSPDDG